LCSSAAGANKFATWKLLGYENKHIRAIFLLEALMMGAIGSLIGAGLGVLLSKGSPKSSWALPPGWLSGNPTTYPWRLAWARA